MYSKELIDNLMSWLILSGLHLTEIKLDKCDDIKGNCYFIFTDVFNIVAKMKSQNCNTICRGWKTSAAQISVELKQEGLRRSLFTSHY